MLKLNNMKRTVATNNDIVINEHTCEFCGRKFVRQNTILKHMCQYKHRWLEKDNHSNRIGFQVWLDFYKKHSMNKKQKTYEEFIKSVYYNAFVKFGTYCVDAMVINVVRYADWLIKNKVNIDTWNSDSIYTKFLIEFLLVEDPLDAIARSIESTIHLSERDGILSQDIFRFGNKNRICYEISKGKISPWILYHSQSGREFLEKLDETQIKIVIDYINPEKWALKNLKNTESVKEVQSLLKIAGY